MEKEPIIKDFIRDFCEVVNEKQREIDRLNKIIKESEVTISHLKFMENHYKEQFEKLNAEKCANKDITKTLKDLTKLTECVDALPF